MGGGLMILICGIRREVPGSKIPLLLQAKQLIGLDKSASAVYFSFFCSL